MPGFVTTGPHGCFRNKKNSQPLSKKNVGTLPDVQVDIWPGQHDKLSVRVAVTLMYVKEVWAKYELGGRLLRRRYQNLHTLVCNSNVCIRGPIASIAYQNYFSAKQ